jgi:DNA polymerase III subunit gamma/tau
VVSDASNVGGKVAAAPSGKEAAGSHSVTRYEPAAAQIPPSIPVTKAGAAVDAEWGLAPAPSSPTHTNTGPTGPEPVSAAPAPSGPAPAVVREYAMASSAPAPAASPTVPAAQPAPVPARTAPAAQPAPAAAPAPTGSRQSLYQRLSNSPEAEAGRAKAPARAIPAAATYVQDIPSADDETIEESGVFGRAAVERILGGKLIEERSLDGSPVTPRY